MSVKFRASSQKSVSSDDNVMAWRSSVQSSSEMSDIQEVAVDDIQVQMDQSHYSMVSTENEDNESVMEQEITATSDPQAQDTIKKTPFMEISMTSDDLTRSMTSYFSRTSDDAPILRELSILDLYPSKKPNRFVVEKIETKNEEGTQTEPKKPFVQKIANRLKSGFESLKDTVTPLQKLPTIRVSKPECEYNASYSHRNSQISDTEADDHQRTLEHPPVIDFYKAESERQPSKILRASLVDLVMGKLKTDDLEEGEKIEDTQEGEKKPDGEKKLLGWFEGVFVRCVSNIFGVMLYLRISWMAGQAGLFWGSMIVLLSTAITLITALSTSAICTNGIVGGGGLYFLISRSLGPEFGGSIGIIFSIANGFGAAMHIVGLAETIRDVLKEHGWYLIDGGTNDVRIIGLAWCTLLICVVYAGTNFESKTQLLFVTIIITSIFDYYIGTLLPINHHQAVRGMTGFSMSTMRENFLPAFRQGYSVVAVFAVFFPAATGIMAGANISGDLKDPGRAIPIGTVLAIFVTSMVYMSFLWMSGSMTVRDADGVNSPVINFNESVSGYYVKPACSFNETCSYGLMNYFQVIELSSFWGPLIIAGVFASTLSSALTCLVSAPKLFQAVCKDKLFPYIGWFGKGYGPNDEPRKAYAMAYFLACGIILIGELNAIAPYITNFYLCAYALTNYACFDCSFSRSPGFRPSFKYYNMWISLLGAILCATSMFIISWYTSMTTFSFFLILFFYLKRAKPPVNWGSTDQAHTYRNALSYVRRLDKLEEHAKTYRPQILVLTGNPASRPSLVDFTYSITKGSSLMICGNVVQIKAENGVLSMIKSLNEKIREWLKSRSVRAFPISVSDTSVRNGTRALLQITGLGRLKPNVLLVGFKQKWSANGIHGLDDLNEYFGIILDAFENQLGVCILRNEQHGLDLTDFMLKHNLGSVPAYKKEGHDWLNKKRKILMRALSPHRYAQQQTIPSKSKSGTFNPNISSSKSLPELRHYSENIGQMSEEETLMNKINQFKIKIKKAVIDVWWLYDDGGLTLLIPYLLTLPKSFLEHAKLRVFTFSTRAGKLDDDQKNMVALLKKFRINFSDVTVFADLKKRPKEKLISEFDTTISAFRVYSSENKSHPGMVTQSELVDQQEKTWRYLRIADLLRKYSKMSNFVVLTLPVPRKGQTSSSLYMAWLDVMTRGLPPTLLVRGNHTSVLTFYS